MVENLEIDDTKREVTIPTGWEEVTIGMFEKLALIDPENPNTWAVAIQTITALTDLTEEEVMMMDVDDTGKIIDAIKFTNTDVDRKPNESIKIEGEEYFLKTDFDKLNNGEVMTIEELTKRYEKPEQGMSEILCVLLRKKKENGKLEGFKAEFMERAEMIRNEVSVSDVYQAMVFFSNGSK
jgi:hypothetical protein